MAKRRTKRRKRRATGRKRRRSRRPSKGGGIGIPPILLLGGLGIGAYLLLSRKEAPPSSEFTATLGPAEAPKRPVGQTVAALMPELVKGAPTNFAEAAKQLDDIKTLWRSGRIADPEEANIRLTGLQTAVQVLNLKGDITSDQHKLLTAQIAQFQNEVKPLVTSAMDAASAIASGVTSLFA